MIGEQLNNLCKVAKVWESMIPLSYKLELTDAAHVSMLTVESLCDSPVFGVESVDLVDISKIIGMKIDKNEKFTTVISDNQFTLEGETTYGFEIYDSGARIAPRPPVIKGDEVQGLINVKALLKVVKQASVLNDFVTFRSWNGEVFVSAEDSEGKGRISRKVGSLDVDLKASFPIDYLLGILNVASDEITLMLINDGPLKIIWSDKYYKYCALLAPRVVY